MLTRFRQRGYPLQILLAAKEKVDAIDRRTLVNPEPPTAKADPSPNRFILVTDYRPSKTSLIRESTDLLFQKVRREPAIADRLPYFRTKFPTEPPMLAFRASHSIGSTLGSFYKKGPSRLQQKKGIGGPSLTFRSHHNVGFFEFMTKARRIGRFNAGCLPADERVRAKGER